MSRRPPALTLMAALCLLTVALGAPLIAAPAAAYGSHVFQANPVLGAGDPFYEVYSGATLAQSIWVTQQYVLSNVTLRVRNDGSAMNPLVVSIHPDDPVRHVPIMSTQLASTSQVAPNGQTPPVNWSFPFNPSPVLQAGTVYWIVAENAAPQGPPLNGYEWHESNADTYPDGSAYVLDPASGVWTGLPYDLYFVTFGKEWASNLSLAMTANPVQVQPGDVVTLTVAFNNTGVSTAPWAWINTTLPSTLENASLTFPGIQPISAAAFPQLAFANVGNGPHAFLVTAQVTIGTPPGTVVTARAALDFQNSTGAFTRGLQASASVVSGLATKQLYLANTSVTAQRLTTRAPTNPTSASSTLSPGAAQPLQFVLDPALAKPFVADQVTVILWVSTQKNPPQTYRLNVSLLEGGTLVASLLPSFTLTTSGFQPMSFSFGTVNHTFASGHPIVLSLSSFGGGGGSTDGLILRYNGTAYPSRVSLVTTTYITVDSLALEDPASNATVWSPLDPIVALANVSDPFGASRIKGVWINISSPTGSVVAAGPMTAVAADPSPLPAWILYNYTLAPPLVTGEYRVYVTAMEDNGVLDRARGYADVAAPRFSLADVTSLGRAQAGGSYAYFLHYNNSGTGSARDLWINETLPVEVSYAASSLPYSSATGNRYSWALRGVGLGDHVLEIDVTVLGSSTAPAWIQDSATLAYTDASGHPEEPLSASAVVFLNGPVFGLGLSSTPAVGLHGNETITYTLSLRNSGADSGTVWMNDTLPAGFTYVGDNAGPLGGGLVINGSRLLYVFAAIPAGANWTIWIMVRAASQIVWNASYLDRLDINYTSTNGYLMPPASASRDLIALSPIFSDAEVNFLLPESVPGGSVPASVLLVNEGNEPASRAWVNLSVDARLTVTDASRSFSASPGSLRFSLLDAPVGVTTIFFNVTVSRTTPDSSDLQMKGGLDAQDGFGNSLPAVPILRTLLLVRAAAFSLSVTPSQPLLEAGVETAFIVTIDNYGSANASNVWLNITFPTILEFVNDTSGASPSEAGNVYSYHWTAPSPVVQSLGVTTFVINVRARPATNNGTAADVAFQLGHEDAYPFSGGTTNLTVHARVLAPLIVLRVESSVPDLLGGATLNYTLFVSNQGSTIARIVSLEDDIDSRLLVVSYTSSVPALGSQNLTWNFSDLAPGESETISLMIRAADGLPAGMDIANSIEATYTNSVGDVLASIRSLPVTIHIGQDLTPYLWFLGAAAVIGAGVVLALARRQRAEIEEVFLVYRDGVLISHLSRTLMREKDEDVLSGMLTAVQEFVREAFQYGEHRELHQLDFGDYRILIERGKFVYLAVVYSGEESPAIRKKVRTVIELIERQFGTVLEKWDGDMEEVVGARDLIRDTLLGSSNHNRVEPATPRYE